MLKNKNFYCISILILYSNIVPLKNTGKLFCFAQSILSGKILGVFHDKREEKWVVNFKKNIASAFQANYEGTAVTDETDSQSKHKSHYRFDRFLSKL